MGRWGGGVRGCGVKGKPQGQKKDFAFVVSSARSPSSALLPFCGEGLPTKSDKKNGTLILTSLLEDLVRKVRGLCQTSARVDLKGICEMESKGSSRGI